MQEVYNIYQDETTQGLIILDDVQKYLKELEIQKFLLYIVINRLHALASVWVLAQNYFQIPKQVSEALTNAFIFKVSKPLISKPSLIF